MKKTRLKIVAALGIPASSGNVARMIGTAPRNPTQLMNAFSRHAKTCGSKRQKYAYRAGQEHYEKGDDKPGTNHGHNLRREDQQAEHQEHGYLHEPGETIVEASEAAFVHKVAVAYYQSGDIDREETVAVQESRASVHQKHKSCGEHGIEAVIIKPDVVDHNHGQAAQQVAFYRPHTHLEHELGGQSNKITQN